MSPGKIPVLTQLQDYSIHALPSLECLEVSASPSWHSSISVIDFITQLIYGATLNSLTFKCQLKFRETDLFWKFVSRHAKTLVSLSAPWWYPTTQIFQRLGIDFTKLQDLTIGRMCSLDVRSCDAVQKPPTKSPSSVDMHRPLLLSKENRCIQP
jgi:hypothetical protein